MMDRLAALLAVHDTLCQSANLPETQRPYSIQSRIDKVQKLIMEEIEREPTTEAKPNDDIPF